MKINGKEYKMPELDFNAICELEDMGIELNDFSKKSMSTIRAFIALAMDGDINRAGKEFEAHLLNGGNVEEIVTEINRMVNESGFFRAFSEKASQRAAESQSRKEPKTAEA